MPKIEEKNIYFFEVEDEDHKLITDQYPNATIFKEPFSEKNIDKCKNAEILSGMVNSKFSEELLIKCPNLKLIVIRAVGYNTVDLKWADENNIPVCNVPDYGSHVIAEHTFALLLASIRNILEGEARTECCNYSWCGLRGIALKGKTFGVIGTGRIGAHVCRIASLGFQMNVIAFDKYPDKKLAEKNKFKYVDSFDELLEQSDVISLHIPLFPETKHMINKETISKMKDGAILINTSRGGLINTPDLIKAIKSKKLSHVALDVIEHEQNIEKDREILTLPGVIITPHIAFYADDSMENMYKEGIKSMKEFMNDKKLCHQVHGH